MEQRLKGKYAWSAIAGFVVLWDNFCGDEQTVSHSFWRAPKWIVWPAWGYLTTHLFWHTPLPIRGILAPFRYARTGLAADNKGLEGLTGPASV